MLYPYQDDAATWVLGQFDAGLRRVALILPTGGGKTVVFSEIIRRWREANHGLRVLVLAHRSELLNQATEKIRLWVPGVRVGLVKAGVHQVWADVIVASEPTLRRQDRMDRMPGDIGLIVVDECHRSMSVSYQRVLEALGTTKPDGPLVLGVTATFTREDTKRLTNYYQAAKEPVDLLDLVNDGYLVPPKFHRVLVEGLDLTAVRSSRLGGAVDLAAGDLDAAMERAGAAGVVAAAYRRHAGDRSGMIFTPTVHSAELVRDALRAEGITSEVLDGGTAKEERARVVRDLNAGRLQTVVNCAILTEGADVPRVSCVMIARPTMSKTLFRQMVGRGVRLFEGKVDCLVRDMVGATGRNDLRTLNDVTDRPVQAREDELLTDAVKREAAARAEILGDARVSGSLATVETDPWEAERRAKMSPAERAAEDSVGPGNEEDIEPKEPPAPRERYQHVEARSGWFLRTYSGVWFIQVEPNISQRGFVCVAKAGERYTVAVCLPGINWREHLVTVESPERAAQIALDLSLGLLPTADQRYLIDPDSRWRRRPMTKSQRRMLEGLGTGNGDESYQGQATDLITVAKLSRAVDNFVRQVVAHEPVSV